MGALELDKLTWPEVERERDAGRDTVVVAFGATEQHGPHMPLATDALIGDHLARLIASELEAFVAPTVRVGCSSHHLAFPGTLSLADATFHAIVADLISSLARGGFRRIVLIPTHGGNFAPLGAAVAKRDPPDGVSVVAMSDISALLRIAMVGVEEHDIPLEQGGLHAGEWETSMLMAIHPELVHLDRGEAGYTGDPQEALQSLVEAGVDSIAPNGVLGDPARASAQHGERYWQVAVEVVLEQIAAQG